MKKPMIRVHWFTQAEVDERVQVGQPFRASQKYGEGWGVEALLCNHGRWRHSILLSPIAEGRLFTVLLHEMVHIVLFTFYRMRSGPLDRAFDSFHVWLSHRSIWWNQYGL